MPDQYEQWSELDGVGPSLAETLQDTDIDPYHIDERDLNQALVKAYGPRLQRSLATKITDQNPERFSYTVPDDLGADGWPL